MDTEEEEKSSVVLSQAVDEPEDEEEEADLPKKPLTAYFMFLAEQRSILVEESKGTGDVMLIVSDAVCMISRGTNIECGKRVNCAGKEVPPLFTANSLRNRMQLQVDRATTG